MPNFKTLPDGYGSSNGDAVGAAYATFAGTDMKIWFADRPIGTLMSLSVSVVRDVVPIYTMASVDVRAFAKGKRSITGTMVFAMFDRHALLDGAFPELLGQQLGQGELIQDYNVAGGGTAYQTLSPGALADFHDWAQYDDFFAEKGVLNYSDQMPPFDITVTMKNEYGDGATFGVFHVVIINEGFGITVDDLSQSMACNFIAKKLAKWTPVKQGWRQYYDYGMLAGGVGPWQYLGGTLQRPAAP